MYRLLSNLVLSLVIFLLPTAQSDRKSDHASPLIFLATDQGLFSAGADDQSFKKISKFQNISFLDSNPKNQSIFLIHRPSPSGLNNLAEVTHDFGKNWLTVDPSKTGLTNPDGTKVTSFGYFAVTDAQTYVAGVGFGRIAVKIKTEKHWRLLGLQASSDNYQVVGEWLYLLSPQGYKNRLVRCSLETFRLEVLTGFENQQPGGSDRLELTDVIGHQLLFRASESGNLRLFDPESQNFSSHLDGSFGSTYVSPEGVVVRNKQSSQVDAWGVSLEKVGSFEAKGVEALNYSLQNGCIYQLSLSQLSCFPSQRSIYLPESLTRSEFAFAGLVVVYPPLPVNHIGPEPILFVSGLGGGELGDLYWEGHQRDLIPLSTISGHDFVLSRSVWTTGQLGYFLTFDFVFSTDICSVAEVVGRSIDYIRLRSGNQKVDLIGYSMGGLLARCFVEGLVPNYDYDSSVDDLLLIAVPNNGSFAAGLAGPLLGFVDLYKGLQASWLTPYSPQIRHINSKPIPPDVSVTVIYGTGFWLPIYEGNDGLVSYFDTRLDPSVKAAVRYIKLPQAVHSQSHDHLDGHYPILEDKIYLFDQIREMGK